MTTPMMPTPREAYAGFEPPPQASEVSDPDNPPWGAGLALLVWLGSIVLLALFQFVAIIPYAVYKAAGGASDAANLAGDPNFLLFGLLGTIPAHAATFALVWLVVTGYRKRPFRQSVGWGWPPRFGPWASAGTAIALLVAGGVVTQFIPGEKTPFEQLLESSAGARFVAAFMATATAPLVEELVYRGVLYPALRRALGGVASFVIVSVMFAAVHIAQYYNNLGVVAAVSMLAFALTFVRARTKSVLPCIVIHLVFNGIQCVVLIVQYFRPDFLNTEATKTGLYTLAAQLPLF